MIGITHLLMGKLVAAKIAANAGKKKQKRRSKQLARGSQAPRAPGASAGANKK